MRGGMVHGYMKWVALALHCSKTGEMAIGLYIHLLDFGWMDLDTYCDVRNTGYATWKHIG